jgi:putative sigma-54 modulation protein
MKIYVSIHGMDLNSDVAAYLERRLLYAVSRFATRIERIEAVLIDISGEWGAGGGVDKRCRIVAMVTGIGRLVVQDDDSELVPLIDRTTDRFGRLVGRKIELRPLSSGTRSTP